LNAATISFARATASGEGVKTALITGTCAGWIAIFAAKPQSVEVAEIGIDGIDREDFRRDRREQAERPHDAIGRGVKTVGAAVRFRVDGGGQILAGPGERRKALGRAAIRAELENGRGRFGGEHKELGRAVGQSRDRFARGELGIEQRRVRARAAFRQHDAVGRAFEHGVEIAVEQAGVERVHAHIELRACGGFARLLEKPNDRGPRRDLRIGGDGVFEIEHERVGARAERLLELFRAVAGNEEEGAHYAGRFFMKACRLHSATSLPSCL
jgi:hypothetical protein